MHQLKMYAELIALRVYCWKDIIKPVTLSQNRLVFVLVVTGFHASIEKLYSYIFINFRCFLPSLSFSPPLPLFLSLRKASFKSS